MKLFLFCNLLMLLVALSLEECLKPENKQQKGYYGWPFEISCIEALDEGDYDYTEPVYEDYSKISCVISEANSGRIALNSTFMGSITDYDFDGDDKNPIDYKLENVARDTATEYEVYVEKDSYCWNYQVTLEPVELPTETCEENLARAEMVYQEKDAGSSSQSRCEVPGNVDEPRDLIHNFHPHPNQTDDKVYWLYNCQDKLPSNAAMRLTTGQFSTALVYDDISYAKNPGNYTCVVEHNNMKRYRVHIRLCVKPKTTSQLSIKCSNQTAQIGQDVEIECHVDAGLGYTSGKHFIGKVNKLNATGHIDLDKREAACVSFVGGERKAIDSRISCQLHKKKVKTTTCFIEPPTEKELKALRTEVTIIYKIRNVKESDFGNFKAGIEAFDIAEASFSLTSDHGPLLATWKMAIIISLSVFVGILLLLLVLRLACGIEYKWICFKLFAPTEKETRRYSAYLAYHYSDDMVATSPVLLQEFLKNLVASLKTMGGDIFDKCKDSTSEQFTADCISKRLDECHRVVIIATPEYINDHWGVYEAYKAWKAVIEKQNAIIFVTFPKTKKAIDELPDEMKTTLKKALKRHNVIKWDGSLPLTRRMKLQLELNMPKLPKRAQSKFDLGQQKRNGYPSVVYINDDNGNVCVGNAV